MALVAPSRLTSLSVGGESEEPEVRRIGLSRGPAREDAASASGKLSPDAMTTVDARSKPSSEIAAMVS